MSEKTGGIYVTGEVLERTHRAGTTNGRDWAFDVLSILTGASVTEVSWQQDSEGTCPREGERTNLQVTLRGSRLSVKRALPLPSATTAAPAAVRAS